jgi:hypothetical protein
LLASLLHLLLKLRHLRFCLIKGDVLHQNRLRHDVERVGIAAQFTVQQRFGVWVFFLEFGLIDLFDEGV